MEENFELYRKYRPSTFDEVVGNETTIKALRRELKNGCHTFLFTGNAGCGKTTLARIMAKEVGAGELSIFEINSASNRGIDTAKELMEQTKYSPSDGDAMVWILDEMHMITTPAQNALLKVLEDTPSHCYFFLCTTNPEKLIEPLKTRCSIINVKPLSDDEMMYLLRRTAKSEKVRLPREIYERIVGLANGGSRKALKLLAKVIYLDDDNERLEALDADEDEDKDAIELCRALIDSRCNWSRLSKILNQIDLSEPEKVRQLVLSYFNSVLLKGKSTLEAVSTIQAFSNVDTFRNGKYAITIACLDTLDLRN